MKSINSSRVSFLQTNMPIRAPSCSVLSLQEAVSCYKRAISLPEARFHVGRCYDYGVGTVEDKILALKWYKQARQQFHGAATLHCCTIMSALSARMATCGCGKLGYPHALGPCLMFQ